MPRQLCVVDPKDIGAIGAAVHDLWFDVGRVEFEPDGRNLVIYLEGDPPFRRGNSHSTASDGEQRLNHLGQLTFNNVKRYSAIESEGIGRYDINTLRYYEGEKRIDVLTNIPLEFQIWVDDFSVNLEI